jgi:hypothetical protein
MTSAALAVTLAARRAGQRKMTAAFGVICLIFVYTTADNVVGRPDGAKIGACFIAAIIGVSLLSRISRALELRALETSYDARAESFLRDCATQHDPARRLRAGSAGRGGVRGEDRPTRRRPRRPGHRRHRLR